MSETRKIKITILLLSLVQMATNGLSPMIAGVRNSFPQESVVAVQFLMTIPGIFVVVFSLVSAWLSTKIEKRFLVSLGALFVTLSGIMAFFLHGSLQILWCWSGVLGLGMGLVNSLTASLIPDCLQGRDQVKYMGAQTSFGNIGGIVMSLLGGLLAAIAWYYNYLVLLIAVPGMLCGLLFLPHSPVVKKKEKEAVRWFRPVGYVVTGCLFLLFFNVVPTSLSLFLQESAKSNTTQVGLLTALFLIGGILCGFVFHFLEGKIHIFTIPAGFGVLGLGLVGISFGRSIVVLTISCLLAGGSIGLVMPQCMAMAAKNAKNRTESAVFLAMVMAGSNLGTFLTPLLTVINRFVWGYENTRNCFILSAVFVSAMMLLYVVVLFWVKKRNQEGKD